MGFEPITFPFAEAAHPYVLPAHAAATLAAFSQASGIMMPVLLCSRRAQTPRQRRLVYPSIDDRKMLPDAVFGFVTGDLHNLLHSQQLPVRKQPVQLLNGSPVIRMFARHSFRLHFFRSCEVRPGPVDAAIPYR